MCRAYLVQLAERGGVVQWNRSGIYERLRLDEYNTVWARRLIDPEPEHIIFPKRYYRCRAVSSDEQVQMGDLLR